MTLLQQLEHDLEVCKKATPDIEPMIKRGRVNLAGTQIWHASGPACFETQAKRDAEFFAHARTRMPQLVEALKEAIDGLQQVDRNAVDISDASDRARHSLNAITRILSSEERR